MSRCKLYNTSSKQHMFKLGRIIMRMEWGKVKGTFRENVANSIIPISLKNRYEQIKCARDWVPQWVFENGTWVNKCKPIVPKWGRQGLPLHELQNDGINSNMG